MGRGGSRISGRCSGRFMGRGASDAGGRSAWGGGDAGLLGGWAAGAGSARDAGRVARVPRAGRPSPDDLLSLSIFDSSATFAFLAMGLRALTVNESVCIEGKNRRDQIRPRRTPLWDHVVQS